MGWAVLFLAGLFEIGWAFGLKWSSGFERLWPSVFSIFCMLLSIGLLGLAMKSIPAGTAYPIWVGMGTAGVMVLGIVVYNEPASFWRMFSVSLILIGIIGLRVTE